MDEIRFYLKIDKDIKEDIILKALSLIYGKVPYVKKNNDLFLVQIDESLVQKLYVSLETLIQDFELEYINILVVPFFNEIFEKYLKNETKITYLYEYLIKNKELQTFIKNIISKENDEIIETVKTYLNLNQSVSQTSEYLFTHRNTVNYRITSFIKHTQINIRQFANQILIINSL